MARYSIFSPCMAFDVFNLNYPLINGKAYTEDDLLVYNVRVDGVPKNTTKEEVLEYFKQFGDIVSVVLHQSRCFVNFADPLSAAKVLQQSEHKINKEYIVVRHSHSWHQPDAQSTAAPASAGDDTTTNSDLLLTLSDDCLDVIFKNLKINDQVNLALCCSRLKDVFALRAKVEYKILDLKKLEFLTLWRARQFIQMAGSQIKKLELRGPHKHFKHIVAFLGIYCTSVKSVSITSEKLLSNDLRKLLNNMSMVEELRLKRTYLKDDGILVLKELTNLKILCLEGIYGLIGQNIKDLTTVESLSLDACKEIDSISFTKVCENLKDLKYLDIQNCPGLKSSAIQGNAKYLHKLETFKLACDNGQVDWIANLPNLKHLLLCIQYSNGPVPSQIFVELAKHRAEQLESLAVGGLNCNYITPETSSFIGELRQLKELQCPYNDYFDDKCLKKISQLQELELLNIQDCKGFTGKGLLDLIQKCPKLKVLNVSNCKQLNEEFAAKSLELLKSEGKERGQRKPLKLIAHGCGISNFAVNSPAFGSATGLLSISFNYEMDGIHTDNFSDSGSYTDDIMDCLDDGCWSDVDFEFWDNL